MPETYKLQCKSPALSAIIKQVASAKRFVVVTGAGISVNCGIPDFRSSEGIFKQIQSAHGGLLSSGRDLFDASVVFRSATTADIFYRWMTHLRHKCADAQPGVVHRFIRQLADRGALLRSYTQNIDGLERKAGLAVWDPYNSKDSETHVPWQAAQSIPLHGTMDHLTCQLCSSSRHFPESPDHAAIVAGDDCPDCKSRSMVREADGRRSLPTGRMRPAVVLYEEPHPHCEAIAKIITHDMRVLGSRRTCSGSQQQKRNVNVVMVFGTTLKVPGCRQLVKKLATASPSTTITVFVNNEPVCGKSWDGIVDYQVIGDVDEWCTRVQRHWNIQPKITQWAKTRKRAHSPRSLPCGNTNGKENAMLSKEDNKAVLATGKKRRHNDTDNAVVTNGNDNNSRIKGGKRQRTSTPLAVPLTLPSLSAATASSAFDAPVRRSLRIAERESMVLYRQAQHQISICT